jgi:regulator of nonsense transcripts 2
MQTRTVELPADSNFAVAVKTQQQAERDEQKRIKDLVLNYDLRADEHDGDDLLSANQHVINAKKGKAASGANTSQTRLEKAGFGRGQPRTRRLQMSDMDWYEKVFLNLAGRASLKLIVSSGGRTRT